MTDDLPTRLRTEAQTAPDHTAALLLEAADAYDKIVRLWSEQTASAGYLARKLAEVDTERLLTLAALEQAQAAAVAWEQRAAEVAHLRRSIIAMREGGHELPASLFRESLEWE